ASGTATATFSGDVIDGNRAIGSFSDGGGIGAGFNGGGVSDTGSGTASISISNTTVNGNTAGRAGGGHAAPDRSASTGPSSLTPHTVTVSGNTAQNGGGGLALELSTGSGNFQDVSDSRATATLTNVTVTGNTAGGPFGFGGGMELIISGGGTGQASV